jgi:hypothetical protein
VKHATKFLLQFKMDSPIINKRKIMYHTKKIEEKII